MDSLRVVGSWIHGAVQQISSDWNEDKIPFRWGHVQWEEPGQMFFLSHLIDCSSVDRCVWYMLVHFFFVTLATYFSSVFSLLTCLIGSTRGGQQPSTCYRLGNPTNWRMRRGAAPCWRIRRPLYSVKRRTLPLFRQKLNCLPIRHLKLQISQAYRANDHMTSCRATWLCKRPFEPPRDGVMNSK